MTGSDPFLCTPAPSPLGSVHCCDERIEADSVVTLLVILASTQVHFPPELPGLGLLPWSISRILASQDAFVCSIILRYQVIGCVCVSFKKARFFFLFPAFLKRLRSEIINSTSHHGHLSLAAPSGCDVKQQVFPRFKSDTEAFVFEDK